MPFLGNTFNVRKARAGGGRLTGSKFNIRSNPNVGSSRVGINTAASGPLPSPGTSEFNKPRNAKGENRIGPKART